MYTSSEIKNLSFSLGAEKCGIASADRFKKAPVGFHPNDIYLKCKSVVVFLIQMPTEIILASNPVPYSHTAHQIYFVKQFKIMAIMQFRYLQIYHTYIGIM